MMSAKLQMLERKLNRATSGEMASHGDSSANKMILLYKEQIDRDAEAAIKAGIKSADDLRVKAEAEVKRLTAKLADLNRNAMQHQDDAARKLREAQAAMDRKMEEMCKVHRAEMESMHVKTEALRQEVAEERHDKAMAQAQVKVAETQKEAAEKMCTHLQQMVEKLQAVKPPAHVQTVAPEPKPMTARVTQRDENGRIVSMSITPSL